MSTSKEAPKKTPEQDVEDTTKLIESKDRAQVAATTAMSVVHVALLRTLLNGGPTAHKYYYAVLVLIILSLVLQVCAGLLALALSHMKSYFQKHKEDACSALFNSLCCCCVCRQDNTAEDANIEKITAFCNNAFDANKHVADDIENKSKESKNNSGETWHCPIHVSYDIASLEHASYEFHSAKLISDLLVAEVDVEMKYLNTLHAGSSRKLDDGSTSVTDEYTAAGVAPMDVNDSKIREYSHKKRHNKVLHHQHAILVSQYEESKKNDILKRLAFWQHVLNYILYFVFIFNIFITGFGVSPSPRNDMANISTGG